MNQQPKQPNPLIFMIVIGLVFALTAGAVFARNGAASMQYSEVLKLFREEQVKSFTLQDGTLTLTLRADGDETKTATASIGDTESFHNDLDALIADQAARGVLTSYNYPQSPGAPWYRTILPYALLGVGLLVVWFFLMNRANGGPSAMAQFTRANRQDAAGARRCRRGGRVVSVHFRLGFCRAVCRRRRQPRARPVRPGKARCALHRLY